MRDFIKYLEELKSEERSDDIKDIVNELGIKKIKFCTSIEFDD